MRSGIRTLTFSIAGLLALGGTLSAFVTSGSSWRSPQIVMHLQLGSSGGTLIDGSASWGQSAEDALAIWNSVIRDTEFRVVRDSTASTFYGNGVNNVYFSSSVEGQSFGGAVAVTLLRTRGNRYVETDVLFNTDFSFNSYRGRLRPAADGGTLYDLRRVAIHEFGHVLGLDHPDEFGQFTSAIMNSRISNIDNLRADDIAGAQSIYGSGDRSSTQLGRILQPDNRSSTTRRRRQVLTGTANPSAGAENVFVFNNRFRSKLFAASGLQRWRASVPLRRGFNRLQVFVETDTGDFERIRTLTVQRLR